MREAHALRLTAVTCGIAQCKPQAIVIDLASRFITVVVVDVTMKADERPRAVFRCFDGVKAAIADDIHRQIQHAGVELGSDCDSSEWSAQLIVAPAPDVAAAGILNTANRPARRILVVTTEGGRQRGAVWRLLHAGAGEVVAWDGAHSRRLTEYIA